MTKAEHVCAFPSAIKSSEAKTESVMWTLMMWAVWRRNVCMHHCFRTVALVNPVLTTNKKLSDLKDTHFRFLGALHLSE